ncbi:vomeronasal type-2 receptor 26-like [Anomaloglossus baeobatrachus]|uniref:vomeronasal type-2 receptor 26-like n=1 Tax=Anomaloglossus baeobatrachus TaxID=238106 RepID=UPI003F4FD808
MTIETAVGTYPSSMSNGKQPSMSGGSCQLHGFIKLHLALKTHLSWSLLPLIISDKKKTHSSMDFLTDLSSSTGKLLGEPSLYVQFGNLSVLVLAEFSLNNLRNESTVTCGTLSLETFSACRLSSNKLPYEYDYYQEGDVIIGGVFSINVFFRFIRSYKVLQTRLMCTIPNVKNYADLMTFIFAVDEINKKSDLLPNITLGYHLYDTCGDSIQSVQNVLRLLSGHQLEVPNYSCRKHGEVAAFVGDTIPMAQLLGTYGYSKISYEDLHPVSKNNDLSKTFFTTAQPESIKSSLISRIAHMFGWNWVGILTPYDYSGDSELQTLRRELERFRVCVAYIIQLSSDLSNNLQNINIIQKSKARVVIIWGKFLVHYSFLKDLKIVREDITFILHESWANGFHLGEEFLQAINCSLIISPMSHYVSGLKNFLHSLDIKNRPKDPILEDILYFYFYCSIPNRHKLFTFQSMYNVTLNDCSGGKYPITAALSTSQYQTFYLVHTAVYILAYALREMIINRKGSHDASRTDGFRGKVPQSRCNERCSPGFRKATKPGHPVCCYDCIVCSEGEMSNTTDSEICHRCTDDKWPDEKKVKCVPKSYEFLSYGDDEIVTVFIAISLLLCIVALFILGVFIHFWDTQIVRANNRTVSFILLVSIFLSFLCVFLFLGRPVDITCLMRQTTFGIFFSISVSCVLSKTIIVCIAFKATKPGSIWKKWVGVKTSNYVVVICSSVQVLICIVWMLVSPPYQEMDMTSYIDRIIIQCNEGSDIWFYSMLGYLGLLAALSFVLAFMVRTLPDSFNEAKYITFSMLVFCSVWIAMIPAYLSTKGKNMVCVEIFAILTSCGGILGCIFFPKCYMILFKKELNIRRQI